MKDAIKYRMSWCVAVLALGCGSEAAAPQSRVPSQMNEGGSSSAETSGHGDDVDDNDDLPEYCGWPSAPAPLWPDLGNPSLLAVDDAMVYWENTQELGDQDVPEPGIYSAPLGGGAPKKLTALTGKLQDLESFGDYLVYARIGHLYKLPKQGGAPTEIETPEPADRRLATFKQLIRHGDELFASSRTGTCVAAKETAVLRLDLTNDRAELAINVQQCITDLAVDDTHFYWTSPGVVARQGRADELPETLSEDISRKSDLSDTPITLVGDAIFLLDHEPSGSTLRRLPKVGGEPSKNLLGSHLMYFANIVSHGEKLFGLACGGAFEFSPDGGELRPLATGLTNIIYGDVAVTDAAVFASASGNVWRLDRE
jgi:hypothetical protein